jgi:hypothetical protein
MSGGLSQQGHAPTPHATAMTHDIMLEIQGPGTFLIFFLFSFSSTDRMIPKQALHVHNKQFNLFNLD